jgi:hypothetical protein
MIRNSLEALAYAIGQEFEKSQCLAEHASISVSVSTGYLSNGLPHCSVRVECGVGCGWLIQTYGSEARELEQIAKVAQTVLSDHNSALSNSEIARLIDQNTTSNFPHENQVLKIPVAGSHLMADDFQS